MNFEADDLDWAMGELANLFAEANRTGIFPHRLNPELFFNGWTVLCIQPFQVRSDCRNTLLFMLTSPFWKVYSNGTIIRNSDLTESGTPKRYENTVTY